MSYSSVLGQHLMTIYPKEKENKIEKGQILPQALL